MHYLFLLLAFGIFLVYTFMQEYSLVSILVMALLVITFIIFDIFRTQKKHSKDESGIFGHVGNETAFFSIIVLIISLILIKTKIIKEFVGMNQFFAFFIVLFLAVASLVLCILGVKGLRKILDETKERKIVNYFNLANIVIDSIVIIYAIYRLIRILKSL